MKIIQIKKSFYCIATNTYDYSSFIDIIKEKIHAVEGSFAYYYSLKIISQLFRYADDLRKNYENYYKLEYDDFKDYLYQKEIFDKNMLSLLDVDESHTILKLNLDLNNYNTSTLFDDYDDNNNLELINEILKVVYI